MELRTKFSIGETIYYILDNAPSKGTVCGITIFTGEKRHSDGSSMKTNKDYNEGVLVTYHIKEYGFNVKEYDAFSSKEELLLSLSVKV